jgi:hypothetical protein
MAQQSWVFSRSDKSKEINLNTDSISILLLESRVPAGDNFVAKDTQVGLLVTTKFQGSTADEPAAAREFPFMFLKTVESDLTHPNSKIISAQGIPINYFPLKDGKTVYRGVSIGVSLVRKQDKATWVKVFDSLVAASNSFTLPSPLSLGLTHLNTFSTNVLQTYLPDPNKQKLVDLGTLSFLVSDKPEELNRITRTGLHLRVLQSKTTGPGWVDPSKQDSYCFYTKFDSDNWTVYVAPKDSAATDIDTAGCSKSKYTQLMNDYIPILIEAQQTAKPTPTALKQMVDAQGLTDIEATKRFQDRANEMRDAAIAQCKDYGVKKCPAVKPEQ